MLDVKHVWGRNFRLLAVVSFIYAAGFHCNIYAAEQETLIPPELENLPYAVYRNVPKDEPEYNTIRLNYIKYQVFPEAIFVPNTQQEAQSVLKGLIKNRLPFSVRSGGHCWEPGSLSPHFVFDTRKFNSIIPDTANETVYVGGGVELGDLIKTIGAIDYAVPTGTCPTVGASGLTLGGGIGLLCRQYGVTSDSVVKITVLNANAEIIEVDADNYPDLFWALRGGGNGSFGIVLGWTYKMYHIPEATFYELTWNWNPKQIAPIMYAWQDWIKDLPSQISSVLAIRHPNDFCAEPDNSPKQVIRIFGLKVGPEPFTEWEAAFKNMNPKPTVKTFTGSYGSLSQYWAKESKLPFGKSMSRVPREPFHQDTISVITRFFEALEREKTPALIYFELEAFGGAMNNLHAAFPYGEGNPFWFLQTGFCALQELSAEIIALLREFDANIPDCVSKCCYANIVDYGLGPSYLPKYYVQNVQRLIEIKKKYDPNNVFHWRQSIPVNWLEEEDSVQ